MQKTNKEQFDKQNFLIVKKQTNNSINKYIYTYISIFQF